MNKKVNNSQKEKLPRLEYCKKIINGVYVREEVKNAVGVLVVGLPRQLGGGGGGGGGAYESGQLVEF